MLSYILKRIDEVEREEVNFDNALNHYHTLVSLYSLKRRLEVEIMESKIKFYFDKIDKDEYIEIGTHEWACIITCDDELEFTDDSIIVYHQPKPYNNKSRKIDILLKSQIEYIVISENVD